MPVLFIIFGLATAAILGALLVWVVIGGALFSSSRFKAVGIFVLIVPTLATLAAVTGSWGLAFAIDALSTHATSAHAWQQWQVLAFWAWPAGFILGGIAGGGFGALVSYAIVKRRPKERGRRSRPPCSRSGVSSGVMMAFASGDS